MSPVQHERELYLVKKKLSQAGPAPALSPVPSPAPAPLSIPRYLTVGTGKASYTEYEVRLVAARGGEAGRDQQVSAAKNLSRVHFIRNGCGWQFASSAAGFYTFLVPCTALVR